MRRAAGGDAPIWPSTLCRALGAALPEDALVVSDTGYSAQWSGSFIDLPHAGQGYLRAAGSLGWALPAALGAKCAVPGRPVVVFAGDGALYYHLLELETARRRGLDVVVVVNDNGGLAQGQRGIAAAYEGREGRREDLYAFGDVSFERLARELECHGATVRDARDLRGALDEALGCGRPAVIDVRTPYAAMPPDPWLPA